MVFLGSQQLESISIRAALHTISTVEIDGNEEEFFPNTRPYKIEEKRAGVSGAEEMAQKLQVFAALAKDLLIDPVQCGK